MKSYSIFTLLLIYIFCYKYVNAATYTVNCATQGGADNHYQFDTYNAGSRQAGWANQDLSVSTPYEKLQVRVEMDVPLLNVGDKMVCDNVHAIPILNAREYLNKYSLEIKNVYGYATGWILDVEPNTVDPLKPLLSFVKTQSGLAATTDFGVTAEYYGFDTIVKDSLGNTIEDGGEDLCKIVFDHLTQSTEGAANLEDLESHLPGDFTTIRNPTEDYDNTPPNWQVWPSQLGLQNIVFPSSFIPKVGSGSWFKTRYEVQCGTTRINPNLINMAFCAADGVYDNGVAAFTEKPNRFLTVLQLPEQCTNSNGETEFIYVSRYIEDEVIENKVTNPWRTGAVLEKQSDTVIKLTVQSVKETNYFGDIPESAAPTSCTNMELFYNHGSDSEDERSFHTVDDLIFRNGDGDLIYSSTCNTVCDDPTTPTLCTHTYEIYSGWVFDRVEMNQIDDEKVGQLDMRVKTKSADGLTVLAGDSRAQIVISIDATTEQSFNNVFDRTLVTDAYTFITHERPLIDALFTTEEYCQVYEESQSDLTSSSDTVDQHGEVSVNLMVTIKFNDDDWILYKSGEMQFATMYLIDGQITGDSVGYVEGQVALSVVSETPENSEQKVTLHYQSTECVPETFNDHSDKESNICKLGYTTYTNVITYNTVVDHDTLYTVQSHYLDVKMLTSPKEAYVVDITTDKTLQNAVKICKLTDGYIATKAQAYDYILDGGSQPGFSLWTLDSDKSHIFTIDTSALDVDDLQQKCQLQNNNNQLERSQECVDLVLDIVCGTDSTNFLEGWENDYNGRSLGDLASILSSNSDCDGTPLHHTVVEKAFTATDTADVLCHGVKPKETFCNHRPDVRFVHNQETLFSTTSGQDLEQCRTSCENDADCHSYIFNGVSVNDSSGTCSVYTTVLQQTQALGTGVWQSGTCFHDDMFLGAPNTFVVKSHSSVWSKYTNNVEPIVRLDRSIENAKIESFLKHDCNQERYTFASYVSQSKHLMEIGTHLEDCVYHNELGFSYKCFVYGWDHMCNEDVLTRGELGMLSSEDYNVILDGRVISNLNSDLEQFFQIIYNSPSCTSFKDNDKWIISIKRNANTAPEYRTGSSAGNTAAEDEGVSIFTEGAQDIQEYDGESYVQACKRKCVEKKDELVPSEQCNGFVWDPSETKCILLHTVIDQGADDDRIVYQPKTDDHLVPVKAIESLITDFHHIPLVLDFKHRTFPAGIVEIYIDSIDLSANENIDDITDLDTRLQASISTPGSSNQLILSAAEYNRKLLAQRDHPYLYMCVDYASGSNYQLYQIYDIERRTAICNVDMTGYIGDTSIFDTGSLSFGQGLIYEDRAFISKKIFDGLVSARTIGLHLKVKHRLLPESVALTQGGRRLAGRKLAEENEIVFTDGILKVENGVYTLLEVTTDTGTKETIIVGASFLEEAFNGKTTVFWIFFWIAIGVNGVVILTLVVKSFVTLSGKAENAWVVIDTIKNGLWVIGHLGVFTVWTISAAATGGSTTLGFFVFLVSALIFAIASVSWVNAKIKKKGNIKFKLLGDEEGSIWKLNS